MAFAAGVLGSMAGQAQGQNAAYQQRLKENADARAAAQQQAQFDAQFSEQQKVDAANIAATNAQTAAIAADRARKDREDGVGLAPFTPPLNHGVAPTLSQKAEIARAESHYYRSHGALNKADEAEKEAADLDKRSQAAAIAAEKTQEDANHLIEIMGRVANWNAQQQLGLKRIAMQETIQIQRGQVTEDVARQRIAASAQQLADRIAAQLKVANLNAAQRAAAAQNLDTVRTQIAQMTQGSANWRALVGQGLESVDANGNPVIPSTGVNIYVGGQGGAGLNTYPPINAGAGGLNSYPPVNAGAGSGVQPPPIQTGGGNGTSVQPPAVGTVTPQAALQGAEAALKRGATLQQVLTTLGTLQLSATAKAQIAQQLRAAAGQ